MLTHFIKLSPRHQQALALLIEQKKRDHFGGIGVGALRDEEDTMTLGEIVSPLAERGLIENLTAVLGESGKYFTRITPLGEFCFRFGYMLKEPHIGSIAEMNKYAAELSAAYEVDNQPMGLA